MKGGMESALENFQKQFAWEPCIENIDTLPHGVNRFLIVGMGGSHLAADILKQARPDLDLIVRSSYGIGPRARAEGRFCIANSYSGNTEEVTDALEEALEARLPSAVIAVGGRIIDIAKKKHLPFVALPDTGIQPRSALGFNLRALAKLLDLDDVLLGTESLTETLDQKSARETGRAIARAMEGKIPCICASVDNEAIAYNWKIKFNETGKIPAFYNVFPELNHNEMTGFDRAASTEPLSEKFHFILLADSTDHPRIKKRMEVTKQLYEARKLAVTVVPIIGDTIYERIFKSLLVADWAALETALLYGVEPEQVPMVEDFKKMIA
ncbi:MAG: hypothetical protein HYS59_01850 [Candidatus Vogelbacteria bacterium]|nr:hypothetical protein [Candidatus Vogelbacteria bacterium]